MYVLTRREGGALAAESIYPLRFDRRELRILTMKGSRGLFCNAQCVQVSADGRSYTFAMFSDYRKVMAEDRAARATERAIRALHESAMAGLPAVVAACRAHYKQPPAEAPVALTVAQIAAMDETAGLTR